MRVLTLDDMEIRQQAFRRWFLTHQHDEAITATGAISCIESAVYDLVMLDHDLAEEHYLTVSEGLSEKPIHDEDCPIAYAGGQGRCVCGAGGYSPGTGMDVVDYIVKMPQERRPKRVIVHSWNPVRSQEMVARLRDAGVPVWKIPFTPILPFQLE